MSTSNQLLQQLQHEVSMLRDYSKALQAQNSTRNQQRKILQSQIQRLSNLQRQGQFRSVTTSIQACQECPKLKSQILKLQNQVERLTRQNNNLQQSYHAVSQSLTKYSTMDSSVNRTTVIRSSTVLNTNNNVKIGDDVERKYKELTQKYDLINCENLQLKKDMEKWKRINVPGLQEKIRKLQSQNSGFNSKIYTFQNQIRNLKATITVKDNQITSLKNKPVTTVLTTNTNTNNTLLQNEIKTLKLSIADKDKQISRLRANQNSSKTFQFQIKNHQSVITSKDNQIARLKQQISKLTTQSSKIYQLESQIRNLKYTITSKDTQLQTLKNKTTEISANQYSKISSLQLQLKNIKIQLINKDSQINSWKLKSTQLQTLKNKIASQQTQISSLKSKLSQPLTQTQIQSPNLSNTLSHYTEQLTTQSVQITKFTTQIADKDIYIKRIQDELKQWIKRDEQKNIQVHKLDRIVNSYVQKIGQLQIQLNRLQKNSLSGSQNNGTATFINTSNTNVNNNDIVVLTEQNRILNQKIHDLERRIQILQETNMSLREQLRLSIQMRSREASRIIMSPQSQSPAPSSPIGNQQQQFIQTIQLLSKQNEGIKQMNNKLKADNQYLQAKLSSSELQIQNLAQFHKNKGIIQLPNIPLNPNLTNFSNTKYSSSSNPNLIINNKLLSNMPVIQTSKSSNYPKQIRVQHAYTVLDDSQRDPISSMITKNNQMRQKLRDRRQSESYRKDSSSQLKSRDNKLKLRQRQRQRQRSDRIMQTNTSKISLNNINNTNINENQRRSNVNVNISNISGYRNSMGNISNVNDTNNVSYDDLQKKINMLKQQNKGLRKHLYQAEQ